MLGCYVGAMVGFVAFALLPLAAFALASVGFGFWLLRKVTAALNTPRGRLLVD